MRLEGRELLKRIAELLYAAPSEFVQQDVRLRRLGQIHCEPAYCERLVPYLPTSGDALPAERQRKRLPRDQLPRVLVRGRD